MILYRIAVAAISLTALGSLTARAVAAEDGILPGFPSFAVGVTGGTLGVGVEGSFKLTEILVLRFGATGYSWDSDGSNSGIAYNWSSDIRSAGLVADLHPFGNGFRLSAGARYLSLDVKGDALFTAAFVIGDETYLSADVGGLSANYSVDKLAPYVGIGFDAAHFGSRFSIGLDAGLIYLGDVDVSLTSERGVTGLAEDLAAEAEALKDDAWYKQFYPVAMMSLKYRF